MKKSTLPLLYSASFVIMFLATNNFLKGQENKEKKDPKSSEEIRVKKIKNRDYKKIEKLIDKEEYLKAKNKCEKLINDNSEDIRLNYLLGNSYFHSEYLNERAVYYLKKSLEYSKIQNKDTIPEALYFLPFAQFKEGKYKEAENAISILDNFFQKSMYGENIKKNINDLKLSIANVKKISSIKNKEISVLNIKGNVNTFNNEYSPVTPPSLDNYMIFTSLNSLAEKKQEKFSDKKRRINESIKIAKHQENDEWIRLDSLENTHEVLNFISTLNNNKRDDAPVYFSKNGKIFFFHRKGILYVSKFKNGKWSKETTFSKLLNNKTNYRVPTIVENNKINEYYLSTSSKNIEDSYGGLDIYFLKMDNEGGILSFENIGDVINTKYDEDSPFLSEDGKTLYFSSKGHNGMGGYDVFKSVKTESGWSKPENLGVPINSIQDDRYYVFDEKKKQGFISSSRTHGKGGMDIYKIQKKKIFKDVTFKGIVYDKTRNIPLRAEITFINPKSNEVVENILTSSNNGLFKTTIPRNDDYIIDILTEEGFTQRVPVKVPPQNENYELFLEIFFEDVMQNNTLYKVVGVKTSFYDPVETIDRFEQETPLDKKNIKNAPPQIEDINNLEKKIVLISRLKDEKPEFYNIQYYASQQLSLKKITLNQAADLLIDFQGNNKMSDDYYTYIQLVSDGEVISKKVKKGGQIKLPILDTKKKYNMKMITKDGYYAEETLDFSKNNTISKINNVLLKIGLDDLTKDSKEKYADANYFFFRSDKVIKDFDSSNVINEEEILNEIKNRKDAQKLIEKRKLKLYQNNAEIANIEKILDPKKYAEKQTSDKKIKGFSEFKNVLFKFDKYKIQKEYLAIIKDVANYMKDNSNSKIEITGHTDALGPKFYNKILSKKRANAVKKELLNLGIKKSRIKLLWKGEEEPLFPNKDKNGNDLKENRKLNRRVSFVKINF